MQYVITKQDHSKLKEKVYQVLISDGTEARVAEIHLALADDVDEYINANISSLFKVARPVLAQRFYVAVQSSMDELINAALSAMYSAFMASETPTLSELFSAAETVFNDTAKGAEWAKLNQVLVTSTEADLKRFIALLSVITLSKSAQS